jgi:hypothetical protein
MGSMHCRLYDENLVHNIILSAGMAAVDFLNAHHDADTDDVCEYLEMHADSIIEDTIDQLNTSNEYPGIEDDEGSWPQPSNGPDE